MKIDSAIKEFTEKYDHEMIESIDGLTRELGYSANGYTMPVFAIKESVDAFVTFMEGYADYKIKHSDDKDAISQEKILEQTSEFIDKQCFAEKTITYPEVSSYVKEYIDSIKILSDTTNKVKAQMMDESVDPEYVGDVNSMIDEFTEKMQSKFYPVMEKMLWASGYNARRRLARAGKETANKSNPAPIFI